MIKGFFVTYEGICQWISYVTACIFYISLPKGKYVCLLDYNSARFIIKSSNFQPHGQHAIEGLCVVIFQMMISSVE